MKRRKVVDARYAKSESYRATLEEIRKRGTCPFCPKHFVMHDRPVLRRRGNWFILRNRWPYKGTRFHFIIVRRQHAEQLNQLTGRDFTQMLWLAQWAVRTFNIKGGGFAMRFGDTRYTGATVCHIHGHIIVPQLEYRDIDGRRQRVARTVPFPFG